MAKWETLGTLKQGDTLAFYLDLKVGGVAVTGAESKLRCQVRSPNYETVYTELVVTESIEKPGRYIFKTAEKGESQDWPVGDCILDVEYTDGEVVSSSKTMKLKIEKDVTRDG